MLHIIIFSSNIHTPMFNLFICQHIFYNFFFYLNSFCWLLSVYFNEWNWRDKALYKLNENILPETESFNICNITCKNPGMAASIWNLLRYYVDLSFISLHITSSYCHLLQPWADRYLVSESGGQKVYESLFVCVCASLHSAFSHENSWIENGDAC